MRRATRNGSKRTGARLPILPKYHALQAIAFWLMVRTRAAHHGPSRRLWSTIPGTQQPGSELARALLAIPKKNYRGSERHTVPVNASAAAYVAYQRSNAKRQRAEALAVTAEALVRRSYWRPALDAYKISLTIQGDADVQQAYDALRAERGFRVVNYEVENETATPRLCVVFSEPLKRGKIDFAKFVAVNGRDPEGVSAEGSQLCIDGLAHGERFEIAVRAGLPADVDDELAKGANLTVYVRDRSPTVRFGGRSYVLPSRGQSGIPVVSINTREVGGKDLPDW